ncbi:hypothetical protein ElyMa_001843200 [Elysia marginata]|uniref:Uncharacterized protein n=1 Tax=Elysia marginata TaxID=1093978 RepID=A0AAV4EKR9_9GAST|nr:hypothetical protein ElyMa_001843200 [Elysia marginata]
MDSRVESDTHPVLVEDDDVSVTRADGCPNSYTGYDVDASSTCFPRTRSVPACSFSGSWGSNTDVDLRPVSSGAGNRSGSLDASLSMSLNGQIISTGIDEEAILQAVVFIEDAYHVSLESFVMHVNINYDLKSPSPTSQNNTGYRMVRTGLG